MRSEGCKIHFKHRNETLRQWFRFCFMVAGCLFLLTAISAHSEAAVPEGLASSGLASIAESRIQAARQDVRSILAGARTLPSDVSRILVSVRDSLRDQGFRVLPLVFLFIVLGLGAQLLIRFLTRPIVRQLDLRPLVKISDRLRQTASLLALTLLELAALAVASIGTFVIFDWPETVRLIVLAYLLAFLGFQAIALMARAVLRPAERSMDESQSLRIMPVGKGVAEFWYRRVLCAAGFTFFAAITIELLSRLGASIESLAFARALLGTFILGIVIETLWRQPEPSPVTGRTQMRKLLNAAYMVILWILWLMGFRILFLFGLVLVLVPVIISISDRAVAHLMRPLNAESAENSWYEATAVIMQRAIRTLVLIGAALYLYSAIRSELGGEAANKSVLYLARIVLNAVVAFALFDFFWRLTRAYIDKKIIDFRQDGFSTNEQAIRRHRISTVLPILRNFLFILTVVIVALMYLSSIGVAIGPLLAGASVFGIAVGFGAQTLVKDVLSGIFYLLDDAFRVGEYIQSGSYMGTVEGFTLRSVRLRHHRGSVFTVPFGSLGAVQNMSRDWALDKIVLGVTYDTDIPKVKKLVKQVGAELTANPEFAPHVLETLKMQGVDELGDFAVKIKLKLMTRPGEQAPIRRWVLTRIKALFEENNINFAYPTVRVAEGQAQLAAGAVHGLSKAGPPPA